MFFQVVVRSQELSSPPKSCLNLVSNEEAVVFSCKVVDALQESLVWNNGSSFSLDWLDHNGGNMWVHLKLMLESVKIVVWYQWETWSVWAELFSARRVGAVSGS